MSHLVDIGVPITKLDKLSGYENTLGEVMASNGARVVMDVLRFDEEPFALISVTEAGDYTITNLEIVSNLDSISSMSMAGHTAEEILVHFPGSFQLDKRYTGNVEDIFEAIRRSGETTYEVTGADYPALGDSMYISDFYGLVLDVEYA